jgi:hypothetical protein
MRQGQQHRRGRGRGGHNNHGNSNNNNNNNQRKIQNPLSRTYHSNGPDGKVSGSPQSIADKYLSLARDALSSGDPVLAENYLQHAEHYNRIILAYREQIAQAQDEAAGGPRRPEAEGEFADEDTDTFGRDLSPLPPEQPRRQPDGRPRDDQPRAFDQSREGPQGQSAGPVGEERAPRFNPEGARDGGRDGGREGRFNDGRRPNRERYGDRQERGGMDRDRPDRDHVARDPSSRDRPDRDRFGERERFNDRDRDRDRFGGRAPQPAYGPDGQLLPERISDRGPDRDRDRGPDRDRGGDRNGNDRPFRQQAPAPRFDAPAREPAPIEPLMDAPRIEASIPVSELPEVRAEAVRPAPRRRERGPALAEDAQPDFLRRPVRRPRREAPVEGAAEAPASAPVEPVVPEREPGVD